MNITELTGLISEKKKIIIVLLSCFLLGAALGMLVLYYILTGAELGGKKITNTEGLLGLSGQEGSASSIYVDLSGAVVNPGIYKLNSNSRVADVVSSGGGILSQASADWVSKNLNLAKRISDEEKVYVPFEWEISGDTKMVVNITDYKEAAQTSSSPSPPSNARNQINVNSASESEILSLPGIGAVYAGKILQNRPYKDIQDMKEAAKIPESVIEKIKELVCF